MRVLVTNDDGISSDGLWALTRELKDIASVVVVAPDRERSAIGTAVTLNQPLKIQKTRPKVPEVEAYSVRGTPADSVILALEKLVKNEIDLVISGINKGLNLGTDVLISGTVGAALQGYLRGIPAIAVSAPLVDNPHLGDIAKVASLLARRIASNGLPSNVFFNINLPDLTLAQISGLRITRLAGEGHVDTVEERYDGKRPYYCLVRRKINNNTDEMSDISAIEHDNISITPLHAYLANKASVNTIDSLFAEFLEELKKG